MIMLSLPLMCLTWKDHCENQFAHLSSLGCGSIFLLNWSILGKEDMSISTKKLCSRTLRRLFSRSLENPICHSTLVDVQAWSRCFGPVKSLINSSHPRKL